MAVRGGKGGKTRPALFLVMLAGLVVGGVIGVYAGELPYMAWLNYGTSFGINPPFTLNLGIIALSLGLNIKFTIAGVIGIIVSVFFFRRL